MVYTETVPPRDLDAILADGKIRAVTNVNQTSYFIYKGEPMGFHFELLKKFADHLELELEIITSNDIDEALGYLQSGDADLVAIGLSVSADRKEMMQFTEPLMQSSQVLVQRKPNGWERMTEKTAAEKLVRNQLDLAGKTIYVQKGSSYAQRLYNLERESGMDIGVIEVPYDAEELARQVSRGEIEYTICDDYMSNIIGTLFPGLDMSTPVSFPLNIAWSVRKDGTDALISELNGWITGFKTTREYARLERKYFSGMRPASIAGSEYFATNSDGKVSPFDDIIKNYADTIGWDWRLVAALIYQESRFNPSVTSPRGAYGLMQVMPSTGLHFGYDVTRSVENNIRAGISYIRMLDRLFSQWVTDPDERVKFILASYNAGHGHVIDAIRLAEKNGLDPGRWDDNVSLFLERKADPAFYDDPVVRNGRLRQGVQVNAYVADILKRYEHYRNLK
ncbi:MAG: transporter substrate-binding domain-containing protein [Bacteroidales bacterium]|nr:transporter substrate-binding domain-containing protein [Bacteroidales bacterium]MDX9927326.1 transporter substrate-binding domain-containing protein [Bacteroidales bacterium]HOC48562.1 transporter substrate-binding domain-containing protein [Bacteroidales bacterium]